MDLKVALNSGGYTPSALRQVDIPKKKPGFRRLLIPGISDRIVHTAMAQVLTPILEAEFEDSSYAYRPGRSVDQAVQAIDRWRKDGYYHVIEADIVGFFDAIRHEQLLVKLDNALMEHSAKDRFLGILEHWLEHLSQHTGTPGMPC